MRYEREPRCVGCWSDWQLLEDQEFMGKHMGRTRFHPFGKGKHMRCLQLSIISHRLILKPMKIIALNMDK